MKTREGTIADLKFDRSNANKGSEFGSHLLRKSVSELGVGRGIVAASDGTIIGGNHVTEMLSELDIDRVVFVPTDGKTLVVTQRMDIDPGTKHFHELALADNKVGQVNLTFDDDVVASLAAEFDIDVGSWGFTPVEEEKTPEPKETPVSDKISFTLSAAQLIDVRKALDTAILEQEIPDEGEPDNEALMIIVNEFLSRRS
ncbi:hypothetical protein GCM10028818_41180 [Spirosoma horti]